MVLIGEGMLQLFNNQQNSSSIYLKDLILQKELLFSVLVSLLFTQ